jgi:phosphoglycolate phosphatase
LIGLIVFDLDGTLIDSRRDLAESTNEMLASYGAAALPLDDVLGMVGEGARVLVQRAMGAAGVGAAVTEALGRFREIYDRRLLVHTRPYDGVPEMLEVAARIAPLALLTNKPDAPTRRLLEAFGMSAMFRWVIGGDGPVPRKPDPAGLWAIMAEARVPASGTWLVGDSMIDVLTARHAGVRLCVVRYGFGQLRGELELDGSEAVASTPADIARLLAQAQNGS